MSDMTSEDQTERIQQLEEQNKQLEQRIEKLEQRLKNPPVSRRAALAGGAGILGLSALSSNASAANNQVGSIGSSTQKVDIFADDVQTDFINNADLTSANDGAILTSNGSGDMEFRFRVEKNGNDSNGVINFKT